MAEVVPPSETVTPVATPATTPVTVQVPTSVVPVGLATKLGLIGTAVLTVITIGLAIAKGDHSVATLETGAGAVTTLLTLMGGRFAQGAALLRNVPTPK